MKEYNTEGKTTLIVMQETREIIQNHKRDFNKLGKLYYLKKYQDCTSIVTTGPGPHEKLYVNCLYDVYGPFKDIKSCFAMRHLINTNNNAHHLLMTSSWEGEGANFCKTINANI